MLLKMVIKSPRNSYGFCVISTRPALNPSQFAGILSTTGAPADRIDDDRALEEHAQASAQPEQRQ